MVAGPSAPHRIPGSPPFCGGPVSHDEGRSPTSNQRGGGGSDRGGGMMPSFMGLVSPFMSCWQPDVNSCVAPSMRRGGPPQHVPPDFPSPVNSPLVDRHKSYQNPKHQHQNQNHLSSPQQKNNIRTPHPNDVLCGRGGSSNRHVGNTNFRSVVAANKEMYVTLTKKQKMLVARAIVQTIHNQEPPGRFLQKDAESGLWFDIGLPRSLEKTSQALREKNSGDKATTSSKERDETGTDASDTATPVPVSPPSSVVSEPTSPKSPSTPVRSTKSSKNTKPPPIKIPPHLAVQFTRKLVRHGPPSPYMDYRSPPPQHRQPYPPSPMSDNAYRVGSPSPRMPPYSPPDPHGQPHPMYAPSSAPYGPPPPPPPPLPRHYGPPPSTYPPHSGGRHPASPVGPHPYHNQPQGAPPGSGALPRQKPRHPPHPHDVAAHLAYPSFSSRSPARRSSASPSPSRSGYASSSPRRSPQVTRRVLPKDFNPPPLGGDSEKTGQPRDNVSPGRQQVYKKQRTKSRSPKRDKMADEAHQQIAASLSYDMQNRLSLTECESKSRGGAMTPPSSVLQSRARRQVTETEQDGLSGLAALAGAALMKLDQDGQKMQQ